MTFHYGLDDIGKSWCVEKYLSIKSIKETRTEFAKHFNRKYFRIAPPHQRLYELVNKFRQTGSVYNQNSKTNVGPTGRYSRRPKVRTPEKVQEVMADAQRSPKKSCAKRIQQLNLSKSSTWRILRHDLDGIHRCWFHILHQYFGLKCLANSVRVSID